MKILDPLPYSSVIVLNYFGEKVIESTIQSLMEMDYPKDRFEVIVVDNNSQDKSRNIINALKGKYGNIKTIFLEKNLGFAKGNNIGIRQSNGEFVALLNNDCVVDKEWLRELVITASRDRKIFAVGSKILLYPKYVSLSIELDPKQFLDNCFLTESHLRNFTKRNVENGIFEKNGHYEIELLYDPIKDSRVVISFSVNKKTINQKKALGIKIPNLEKRNYKIRSRVRSNDIIYEVQINLKDKYILRSSYNKIQNAGIVVFQDGFGRDIGSLIREHSQYYEKDVRQFDQEKEIYAACGAAVLYRTEIFKKIGYLDESFFMYYEDDEICERARIKGYKVYYSPKAVVRHIHALSSGEWSPFFIFHTGKGRLLHVFYTFPLRVFLGEYLKMIGLILGNFAFLLSRLSSLLNYLKKSGPDKKLQNLDKEIQYLKILLYFIYNSPLLIFKKLRKGLSAKGIESNYQSITDGRWYFEQK